jgi:hypothetical protein
MLFLKAGPIAKDERVLQSILLLFIPRDVSKASIYMGFISAAGLSKG